ncbi:TIGR03086 family metal-binding protein [Streptomyces lydicus]|uniref:TIGR03086 family metal-binding protein n=1 Tax=Streptomyces lydicus TaxID=47763 RepID=UPI00378F7B3A
MHMNYDAQSAPRTAPDAGAVDATVPSATAPRPDLAHLLALHAGAVRDSVTLVRRVTPDDLPRPTPCSAWTLADLLAHMTAQHHGFAAAARGDGRDPAPWTVHPLGADPVTRYAAAADEVIAAFAAVGTPDQPFALPEFTTARTFPAHRAIGFHLIDYVVHTWDVARALGLDHVPGAALLDAALPLAYAVPDDDSRRTPGSAFRPALTPAAHAGPLERILTALGRSPDWPTPLP